MADASAAFSYCWLAYAAAVVAHSEMNCIRAAKPPGGTAAGTAGRAYKTEVSTRAMRRSAASASSRRRSRKPLPPENASANQAGSCSSAQAAQMQAAVSRGRHCRRSEAHAAEGFAPYSSRRHAHASAAWRTSTAAAQTQKAREGRSRAPAQAPRRFSLRKQDAGTRPDASVHASTAAKTRTLHRE